MSIFRKIAGTGAVAAAAAFALFLNVAGGLPVLSTAAAADETSGENGPAVVYGNPDAPLTIIEYASLTCPHCAAFHTEELPAIKQELIETGKVRLEFRDFPLDQLALRASMLIRCAPPEHRAPMLDVLFRNQKNWATSQDPLGALNRIGRMSGMSEAKANQCLSDQKLADVVIAQRLEGEKVYQVNSTPSFVIGGQLYKGTMNLESVKDILAKQNQ
jgi:protein-disulfide isomerase